MTKARSRSPGFEPGLAVCESSMLPLDRWSRPRLLTTYKISTKLISFCFPIPDSVSPALNSQIINPSTPETGAKVCTVPHGITTRPLKERKASRKVGTAAGRPVRPAFRGCFAQVPTNRKNPKNSFASIS